MEAGAEAKDIDAVAAASAAAEPAEDAAKEADEGMVAHDEGAETATT